MINAIIEKLTTPKGAIILLIVIMALVGLFYTDLSELSGASILGQSDITFEDVDGEQVSYWVIPITQQEFINEEIRTESVSKNIPSATNSKGEFISGDINADFSFEVKSLGLRTPMVKGNTDKTYVTKIYDADITNEFWDFKEFEPTSEFSTEGIEYYDSTINSWKPNLIYQAKVIVDGEIFTLNMDKTTQTGTRYVVPNTKPAIYFEESGIMASRNSASAPSILPLSVILYGSNNNEMIFINRESKTVETILNEDTTQHITYFENIKLGWNDVMSNNFQTVSSSWDSRIMIYEKVGNKYVDMRFNEAKFDNSEIVFDFNNDVVNGEWYIYNPYDSRYYKVNSISDFELLNINYNEYTLDESIPQLEFKTPVVILGAWHIPVEYGNVFVHENVPVPSITRVELMSELYDTGSAILEVDVKVTGDAGSVITELLPGLNTEYVILTPQTITENFDVGETKTLKFTITGSDTTGDFDGSFMIKATGSSGDTSTKEIEYKLKDSDLIKDSDKIIITIRAVDKDGRLLGTDYPIIVSQTNTKQYGMWTGKVNKGDIQISGIETNELFPQDKIITVTDSNTEFTLVYAEKYYVPPTNWSTIFLILFAIFAVIAIGYGAYLVLEEK